MFLSRFGYLFKQRTRCIFSHLVSTGFAPQEISFLFSAFLSSTFLILNMTFDRFYSIIMPHKAASFNTVKRAKTTIVCATVISSLYNLPHLLITAIDGKQCLPFAAALDKTSGKFYYWSQFTLTFALPFVLLLFMNSVIIHTIRTRSLMNDMGLESQGRRKGQGQVTSERQIFAIFFLVTFGFLTLTSPGALLILYMMFVDVMESPRVFASYYLFYNIGQKLYYTNSGINFFMYVLSGRKFRTDLVRLFTCKDVMHQTDTNRFHGNCDRKCTGVTFWYAPILHCTIGAHIYGIPVCVCS